MSAELRCTVTAIECLPHSGPQSVVHVVLSGSLFFVAEAEDIFQLLRQTDESS